MLVMVGVQIDRPAECGGVLQVLDWDERREGMELKPSVLRQRDLPSWVFPEGRNPLLQPAAPPHATSSCNGAATEPAAAGVATPSSDQAGSGVLCDDCSKGSSGAAAGGGVGSGDGKRVEAQAVTSMKQEQQDAMAAAAVQGLPQPVKPAAGGGERVGQPAVKTEGAAVKKDEAAMEVEVKGGAAGRGGGGGHALQLQPPPLQQQQQPAAGVTGATPGAVAAAVGCILWYWYDLLLIGCTQVS
jgi:hypothetical protein